jgi:hypothetical protein
MKRTFASKTFSAWSFHCMTLVGMMTLQHFYLAEAETTSAGAVVGQDFHAGATIGQEFHTGATIGQCNG